MTEPGTIEERNGRTVDARCLQEVTQVHIRAFPRSALTLLGPDVVHAYYRWHLLERYDPLLLLYRQRDEVRGYCLAGAFTGSAKGFRRAHGPLLCWSALCHPGAAARQALRSLSPRGGATVPEELRYQGEGGEASRNLLALAVLPSSQGQGIGRSLMGEMEARARSSGYRRMHLSVDAENTSARAFYEAVGYRYVFESGSWNGRMARTLEGRGAE